MTETAPRGLSDLLRHRACVQSDRTALIDGDAQLSWSEFDRAVSAAARALAATGVRPGDRVSIQLPTGMDLVRLVLGAMRAGAVAVPINPAYTTAEIDIIRGDCGATLHLDASTAGAVLDSAQTADDDSDPQADRGGEHIAALLYTSGTSGRPRGAMLSSRALLANLDQVAAVTPPLLTGSDVLFVPLPLTHIFGLNAGLGMALRVGATAVLADQFDPAATLATMAEHQVSCVLGVPAQYAQWLGDPAMPAGFGNVRFAMSGSAPLPASVVDGYAEHGIALHDGYGLTEAAPVVAISAISDRDHVRHGSVGLPLPGVQVELRDADGEPVDPDDPGRIFLRGANLFSGYWPDGSDGPDADGWFGTGDIAVRDADGQLHVIGRSTDMVIVNGFNVYPAEVEEVLARQSGVAEVAVTGAPDPVTGESVVAYVVAAAGALLLPADLIAAASRNLARFKLPVRVEIVDRLPRTVTGKIMKWQLRGPRGAAG